MRRVGTFTRGPSRWSDRRKHGQTLHAEPEPCRQQRSDGREMFLGERTDLMSSIEEYAV